MCSEEVIEIFVPVPDQATDLAVGRTFAKQSPLPHQRHGTTEHLGCAGFVKKILITHVWLHALDLSSLTNYWASAIARHSQHEIFR
jgi:hypothetical protein